MTNELRGPSKSLICVCLFFLVLTCISFQWQILPDFGSKYPDRNFYGFIFGGFLGVVALARFEYVDAIRLSSRKSYEWSFMSGRATARLITVTGWVLSLWHAISWVRELTRL